MCRYTNASDRLMDTNDSPRSILAAVCGWDATIVWDNGKLSEQSRIHPDFFNMSERRGWVVSTPFRAANTIIIATHLLECQSKFHW